MRSAVSLQIHLRVLTYCISWELGTEAEALTELDWPALSVFSSTFPPPYKLNDANNASDVLKIAQGYVKSKMRVQFI